MLSLERQTSSSVEQIGDKEVCIVVKQSIFTLTITSPHRIDGTLLCELVYDIEDLIPVGYVSQNPLTYKINTITSNTINIECKLAVLSSKHEDLLFRVHVRLMNGNIPIASLYSKPIKSTSKADSHRKIRSQMGNDKVKLESKPKRIPTTPRKQSSRKTVKYSGMNEQNQMQFGYSMQNDQRMNEMRIVETNRLLLDKLKANLSQQNEKTKTLQGSVEELALRLSQYDYNHNIELVYDVSTLFTSDQLEVLQEISSILQSACPMQNHLRASPMSGMMDSHLNGNFQNPTQQVYNPCREVVGLFLPRNGDDSY